MVKSADRFFKGFSLEGYKLQILINALEKERKQCLNRLKEEKHIFKMSIKAPVKCGEECWSQYGEIFHANGDKRDNSSITKMYVEQHKDENLNLNSFSQDSRTSSEQKSSSAMSGSMNSYGQMSPAIQGSCFQIIRDRNSCREKNGSKIKITNPPSLSLLEILCADIENGAVVGKRTQNKPYSHGTDLFAGTLGHRRANQTRITEQETLVLVPDNGIIKKRGIVDGHEEPRSSKSTNRKTTKSQDSEKSNCNSFEGLSSNNSTPQKAPISKRYLSCQDTSFQGGSSKSGSVFYELEDGRDKIQLKRTGKEVPSAKGFQLGLSTACARTIEGTCVSSITCSSDNATPESRISNYKFPQFEDGGKSLTRKSKKQKYINLGKRKLSRTSYSGIRLFQVEDLQGYQRGNSQEGIDKQTRDKMDEFFAKVERTKCFQKDEQRWRCVSGVESIQRRNEKKSTLEIESRMFACKNGHGYRRAKPWPTQVWS